MPDVVSRPRSASHLPSLLLLGPALRRLGLGLALAGGLSACAGEAGLSAPPDLPGAPLQPQTAWTALFNGQNLDGWSSWLPSRGLNSDPEGVFKVQDGELRVLDLTPTAGDREYGYLLTDAPHDNYRLRLQYRWDTQKFAPRANEPRDTGVLYHVTGPNRIWPASAEFQIMEGATGDLWGLDGTNFTATVRDPAARELTYDPFGRPVTTGEAPGGYRRMGRADGVREVAGWNTLELVVSGDEATQIVNGQVAAQVSGLRAPGGAPLTAGRIALQAEGAAVTYRNIELRPLAYLTPPAGARTLLGGSSTPASVAADWLDRRGGEVRWPVQGGVATVRPSGDPQDTNDLHTREQFGDLRLHLEFRLPPTRPGAAEQDRANSGVYLQGRYEVQILDSFGAALSGQNDLGAIYGQQDASSNAALPAGTWQSYDIEFRAARWTGGQKTEDARATVWLNGEKIQDNVALSGPTMLGAPEADTPGPIVLQDHGSGVSFRNIWVEALE